MDNITPGTLDATEIKPKLVQERNVKNDNITLNVENLSEYPEDWTASKSISLAVETARTSFKNGWTKPLEFRESQINQLVKLVEDNTKEIVTALKEDMHKPDFECLFSEIMMVTNECISMLNSLSDWAKPEKGIRNFLHILSDPLILRQPYGVVLVISPWNYPLNLSLLPFAGAIAAGNTVVLKPSEISPATSKLMAKLIPQYLDRRCYHIILGGIEETTELLEKRFDYIFYTGNPEVGKIIQKAASKHLTPVTLELGGKNPCYIDATADMEATVQLIIATKWFNVGQTCVAIDYVLCTKEVQDNFITVLGKALLQVYGTEPIESPYLGRIVNDKHFQRIVKYFKDGTIALGGQTDQSQRFIAPTVLINAKHNSAVAKDEIFGPVLPIFVVKDEDEAISFINEREPALALYMYTRSKETREKFIECTQSGSILVNDSFTFMLNSSLPFGGVGHSGMGAYHGKHSFETFSHKRTCLISRFNPVMNYVNRLRNPPLRDDDVTIKYYKFILKERHWERIQFWLTLLAIALALAAGYMLRSWVKKYRKRNIITADFADLDDDDDDDFDDIEEKTTLGY